MSDKEKAITATASELRYSENMVRNIVETYLAKVKESRKKK